MPENNYVSLNLSGGSGKSPAAAHQLLDGSLALLGDLLLAQDAPKAAALAERFEACRKAIADGAPAQDVSSLGAQCFAAGREVVAELQALRAARTREMASVVVALREVVTAVGSEMSTFHAGLEESTGRFESLGALTDPVQIRKRLVEEVEALKQLTVSRRKVWEETAGRLNQRIATLERQLIVIQTEAATDPLTQINNRRVFERTCEDWIETPRASFVLALVDVDDLKKVNDTHGHHAGDHVLHFVAQTLARSLRAGDVVARIGGDEFAVLAPNLTLAQAQLRLRSVLSAMTDPSLARLERPVHMTAVSCGLAEFSAGDTFATLLKRADEALYASKRGGKNRLVARPAAFIKDLLRR